MYLTFKGLNACKTCYDNRLSYTIMDLPLLLIQVTLEPGGDTVHAIKAFPHVYNLE